MDTIITIVVFIAISAAAQWLKRRQGGGDDDWDEQEAPPRSPGSPAPAPKPTSSWEEELRRLLNEAAPTNPRPAAPPILPVPKPAAKPPPVPKSAPVPPLLPGIPPVVMRHAPQTLAEEAREMAPLAQSQRGYERASQLDNQVAQNLVKVDPHHQHYYKGACQRCGGRLEFPVSAVGTTIVCPHCRNDTSLVVQQAAPHLQLNRPVPRRQPPVAAVRVVKQLRSPVTARDVVVASVILGQPKAMEI